MAAVLVILALLLQPVCGYSEASGPYPTIQSKFGTVIGKSFIFDGGEHLPIIKTVNGYLSIPYAEPPVGPLRFMSPVAKSWTVKDGGNYNATVNRAACPQLKTQHFNFPEEITEDCLHLDVYTPNPTPKAAPVMVYIHGGGFVMGTGTTQLSSPVPIVALGDVIVVIINYRTNVFGFFSTGDDVVKGNAGLKDQVMALKWVQENIESFGGDPNRVTLFGESAGGISTTYHLVSPMSRGLIRNVILQSGSLLGGMQRGPETQDSQMKRAFALGRIVGCEQTKTNELVECLQAVDFEILLANYTQTIAETGEHPMTNPFSPNSDGEFLTDIAERLFENPSNIAQVSAMIGELADEGNVVFSMVYPTYIEEEPIVNQTDYDMILDMMMINQVPTGLARQTLKLIYLTDQQISDPTLDRKDGINHLLGDLWFVCPDIKTSKYMVSEGNDVYAYHWTHVPSASLWGATWFGATHAEDLTFVFGSHFNEHMSQLYNRFTKDEIKLTKDVITYWTNFAKYGNPNSANDCLPDWPKFTVSEQAYKEIKIGFANGRLLNPLACEYINGIVPRIVAMEQRQDAQCDNTNSCGTI